MCEINWKIDHVIKDIQKQTLFIKYTIQLVEHEKHSISQLRRSFKCTNKPDLKKFDTRMNEKLLEN